MKLLQNYPVICFFLLMAWSAGYAYLLKEYGHLVPWFDTDSKKVAWVYLGSVVVFFLLLQGFIAFWQ